jgi:hypothetical protein
MLLIEIRNYTETKCINIGILINIDDQVLWTPYTLIIFIINKIYYMYSIQRLEYCSTDGSRGSSCWGSASDFNIKELVNRFLARGTNQQSSHIHSQLLTRRIICVHENSPRFSNLGKKSSFQAWIGIPKILS